MARSALVVALVCASAHAFAGPRANVGARVAMRSAADGGAAPAAPPTRNDTLTGAQLALMLSDVRTHYRKPFLDDPKSDAAAEEGARVRKRLYRTRFDGLQLDRVAAAPSAIHGRGLVTTRGVVTGELLTCYPGDALLLWPDADPAKRVEGCELNALFGVHVPMPEQASAELFLRKDRARDYELFATECWSIVGDPARDRDPAYLGHLANDGACMVAGDTLSRANYLQNSEKAANAAVATVEGGHCALVATEAIAAGEEVLVSYGEYYWLTRSGFMTTEAKAKNRAERKAKRLPESMSNPFLEADSKPRKKSGGGFGK